MCGIAGFLNNDQNKNNKVIIKKMIKNLEHRGPDSKGYFSDKYVTLGHSRLKIIDLKNGSQPMKSKSGNILIYNGEIFNFRDLRESLKKKYIFKTASDTEVLLAGLEIEGLSFLKKLNGFFAFAYWIRKKKKLIIARDPLGIKPLYYYKSKKKLYFASETQSLFIKEEKKLNSKKDLFFEYLTRSSPSFNQTFFKNVFEVQPGFFLIIDTKNKIKKIKYYDISTSWKKTRKDELPINSEDFKIKLEKNFSMLMKNQTISDTKLGICLSSGLDSNFIFSFLNDVYKKKVWSYTYSNNFKNEETDILKKNLKKISINKNKFRQKYVQINYSKYIDSIVNPRSIDHPLVYEATYPISRICRSAKKESVKVLMSGQGADELFFGYDRYQYLLNKNKKRLKNDEIYYGHGLRNIKQIEKITGLKKRKFEKNSYTYQWLIGSKLKKLKKLIIFDQKFRLQMLLKRDDLASMENGVEMRVPFLDLNFLNWMNAVSDKLKYNFRYKKKILQEILKEKINLNYKNYKKIGSVSDSRYWMRSKDFREKLISLIEEKNSISKNFLNLKEIKKIIKNDKNEKFFFIKWSLFNLETWRKQNFSKN